MNRSMEGHTSDILLKPRAARQGLGRTGERLAAEALVGRGCRIRERNFRCTYGEVDLVAEDEDDIIFV